MRGGIEIPDDLAEALEAAPEAKVAFLQLPASHKREYLDWILEANKPETRARRVTKTVERLLG